MNKLYTTIVLCVILIYSKNGYGQIKDSLNDKSAAQHFFTTGVAGGYATLQDQGISPLTYAGPGGGAQIGYLSNSKRALSLAYVRFDFNLLQSKISGGEIYSYRTSGAYQYFPKRWAFNTSKINWVPGVGLDFNWVLRDHTTFTNNSLNIDTRIALSPAININRDFKLWKRDFEAGIVLSFPLVSYISRPLFASTQFPGTVNNDEPKWYDYLSKGSIYSFGKIFRVKSQSYLQYTFKNRNGIRLDYYWSYANLKSENPIKNGENVFLISTMLKL